MAVDSLKVRLHKGKLKSSLATVYKLVWNHPFLAAMLLLLIYLQWHFPLLFSLLVSASPVVICTALLLATLLIHGVPNDHKPRGRSDINTLKTTLSENTSSPKEKEGYNRERFAEVRNDIVEKGMKAYFAEFEDKEAQMRKLIAEKSDKMSRVHDSILDYSLNQQKHVDEYATDHGSTDVESDEAEGSFLDALVGEGTPTHQETQRLLDSEDHPPHPDLSRSHSVSPKSEEDEVVGSEDDDEEDDNVKRGEAEPVIMWTEEDERNLRYLGSCELERNQCLENLIAKRRRQRNFSMISERKLMDLNHYNLPSFQVSPIVTVNHKVKSRFDVANNMSPSSAPSATFPRKNPFDSPCISPKSGEQKANPFDAPHYAKEHLLRRYESLNPGYNLVEDGGALIMQGHRKDALFPTHESYTSSLTFPNLSTLEKPTEGFHMKPMFVQQANPTDRQSSPGSESAMSSVSDADSSVAYTNPELGLHGNQSDRTHYAKMEKDNNHDHGPSRSSSTTPKADNNHGNTDQVEAEGRQEPNSVEEYDVKHKSNGDDPDKDPIYDTSPSAVHNNRSFSPAAEM